MAHRRKLALSVAAIAIVGVGGLVALRASGGLIKRTKSVTVPVDTGPGGTATATAGCPKGKRVVLGGFEVPLSAADASTTHLELGGERGWRAGVVNYDGDEKSTLTSIAYCGRLEGVRARKRTVRIPTQGPSASPVTVAAHCRRGERLAFGGFQYDQGPAPGESNDAYLSELRRTGKRGWQVGAFNFSGTAPMTAIAYCSRHSPPTTTAKESVTVEGSGKARVTARCDRGERLAFGGYSADVTYSKAFVLLHGLKRTGARALQVSARNGNSTGAGKLTAYAYCAKG
jgi:hypothetical protein